MYRKELPTWCGAYDPCESKEVAVVGNGPLSAQQRSELNSGRYQVIVRFNYLNNRCRRSAIWSKYLDGPLQAIAHC